MSIMNIKKFLSAMLIQKFVIKYLCLVSIEPITLDINYFPVLEWNREAWGWVSIVIV